MPAMKLTYEQARELAGSLQGTCDSIQIAIERMNLDPDDFEVDEVEAQVCEHGVERCEGCGWWHESGELVNEAGDVVGCDQCRPAEDD